MIYGQTSMVSYAYDIANRLTEVEGVPYVYDANGNLLNDGTNDYAYDSANRLISVSGQSTVSSYQYSGLGDRLSQTVDGQVTNYTLDLNAGLTQVLDDGTNTYTHGLGRISQTNTNTEYFLGDALGSVRQLVSQSGQVTYANMTVVLRKALKITLSSLIMHEKYALLCVTLPRRIHGIILDKYAISPTA